MKHQAKAILALKGSAKTHRLFQGTVLLKEDHLAYEKNKEAVSKPTCPALE